MKIEQRDGSPFHSTEMKNKTKSISNPMSLTAPQFEAPRVTGHIDNCQADNSIIQVMQKENNLLELLDITKTSSASQ